MELHEYEWALYEVCGEPLGDMWQAGGTAPNREDAERERHVRPGADVRCCWNCKHWHVREYIHCQCSGPWGGDIRGDLRCTFTPATRSQMLTRHGFKRRPTWRSLPSDE